MDFQLKYTSQYTGEQIDQAVNFFSTQVAPVFDSTETYYTNDFVIHDGLLYQYINSTSKSGAWTASDWQLQKIFDNSGYWIIDGLAAPTEREVYQDVEYIENTSAGPYINTGYVPDNTTEIEIKMRAFSYTTASTNSQALFIITDKNNSRYHGIYFPTSTKLRFCMMTNLSVQSNIVDYSSFAYDTDYTLKMKVSTDSTQCYVNGALVGTIAEDFSYIYTETLRINAFYSGRSSAVVTSWDNLNRYYYVKIWQNGTLVRDLVPCYRLSDGVIGMRDRANNNTFYTNAGTGSFAKGPVTCI